MSPRAPRSRPRWTHAACVSVTQARGAMESGPSTTRHQTLLTRGEVNSAFQQAPVLSNANSDSPWARAAHSQSRRPPSPRCPAGARGELVYHGLVVTGRSSNPVGTDRCAPPPPDQLFPAQVRSTAYDQPHPPLHDRGHAGSEQLARVTRGHGGHLGARGHRRQGTDPGTRRGHLQAV
jgi:hypothetical protein